MATNIKKAFKDYLNKPEIKEVLDSASKWAEDNKTFCDRVTANWQKTEDDAKKCESKKDDSSIWDLL